jgi:ketosteroid isomerase-like protein
VRAVLADREIEALDWLAALRGVTRSARVRQLVREASPTPPPPPTVEELLAAVQPRRRGCSAPLPRDTGRAMSQENVERIKAGFAAHNSGDIDALVEVYAPDAVFETLLLGTHHGNEAIRWIYEENQKTLSGYDVVPVELIDIGDKVVAVAQAVGAGPASDIAVDEPFAFVFTFKGERVVREQAFRNKEEALEAVGLSE